MCQQELSVRRYEDPPFRPPGSLPAMLWNPNTPPLGSLEQDSDGITPARLWNIVRWFFDKAAKVIGESCTAKVNKLQRGQPALDALHARDPCARARRRANHGERQPAAYIAVHDLDLFAQR